MKSWLWIIGSVLVLSATIAHATNLGKTTVALDGKAISMQETNLGNFIADAIRNTSGADVAIIHAMAFRADAEIAAGPVDEQAIRNVLSLPTEKIVTLTLTPSALRNVMKRALGRYPEANKAFLQIAGMQVVFDGKQTTNRVQSITVNGKALDFSASTPITVAMPLGLAKGAVGYFVEFTDDVTKSMDIKDVTLLDAVGKEFTRQNGSITPIIDGRLKDVNQK